MKLSRVLAIALKETMHIRRDPFILAMAIGLPVILVIFFGFAINFDFKHINLAVFDMDHSKQSRELARMFGSSDYFNVRTQGLETNPTQEVGSEHSSIAVVINPEFFKDIALQTGANVQILVDGTDNMKSGVIIGYIAGLGQIANRFFSSSPQKNPLEIIPVPIVDIAEFVFDATLDQGRPFGMCIRGNHFIRSNDCEL